MKNIGSMIALIALLLAANSSLAQRCDAYYPFEDSLADIGGNGFDGQMITADGAAATPEFANGRIGRALRITDGGAMRALADLHYDRCPQITIMAWIKLESLDAGGNQYVFSTGQGSGPGLFAQGPTLRLNGTENGLLYSGAIRDADAWFLVAGIYDYEQGTYSLFWRNDVVAEGLLSDSRYGAEDAFWVGTLNDGLSSTARNLYVDELRVFGRTLSPDEISAASTGANAPTQSFVPADPSSLPACSVQSDCGAGTYCAVDNTCHPESHLPKTSFDLADLVADDPFDIQLGGDGPEIDPPAVFEDELGFQVWIGSGSWCLVSSTRNGVTVTPNREYIKNTVGSGFEIPNNPGVHYNGGLTWDPETNVATMRLDDSQLMNPAGLSAEWSGPMSSPTERRFTWTVDGEEHRFVRGKCTEELEVDLNRLLPDYFARGSWCDRGIPYFFYRDGTGYFYSDPSDGETLTIFDWTWSRSSRTLRMIERESNEDTSRPISDVTRSFFYWRNSRFEKGDCP